MNTLKTNRIDSLKAFISTEIWYNPSAYAAGPYGQTYVFASSAKRDEVGLISEVEFEALTTQMRDLKQELELINVLDRSYHAYQDHYLLAVIKLARSLYHLMRLAKATENFEVKDGSAIVFVEVLLNAAIKLKLTTVVLISCINFIILSTTSYIIFSNPIPTQEGKGEKHDSKRTRPEVDNVTRDYIKQARRLGPSNNKVNSDYHGTKR